MECEGTQEWDTKCSAAVMSSTMKCGMRRFCLIWGSHFYKLILETPGNTLSILFFRGCQLVVVNQLVNIYTGEHSIHQLSRPADPGSKSSHRHLMNWNEAGFEFCPYDTPFGKLT